MPVMTQSAPYYPPLAPNCSKHCCVPKAAAWAKPSQSQAPSRGFGPAQGFTKPEPPKAKPKPGLLGQAGPEHHYMHQTMAMCKGALPTICFLVADYLQAAIM